MPHPNFLRAYLAGQYDKVSKPMDITEKLTREDPLGDLDYEEMTMLSDFNRNRAATLANTEEATKTIIEYCQQRSRDFKEMAAEELDLQDAFEREEADVAPDPMSSMCQDDNDVDQAI